MFGCDSLFITSTSFSISACAASDLSRDGGVGSVWASRRVKERGQSAYCLEAAAAVDGPELSEARRAII